MIEGLKVTVPGTEVHKMCLDRRAHHRKRADFYRAQLTAFTDREPGDNELLEKGASNDPRSMFDRKMRNHQTETEELEFIAKWLNQAETYLLDDPALRKLGVIHNYW